MPSLYFNTAHLDSLSSAIRRMRWAIAAFIMVASLARVTPLTAPTLTVHVLAEVQPSALGHITIEAYLARIATNRLA